MNAGYYITTPIDQFDLAHAFRSAKQQDELVMAIFRFHRRAMSPSDVFHVGEAMGHKWLLTSVRRSMSTLANVGALTHTSETKRGPHGRPETLWVLSDSAMAIAA